MYHRRKASLSPINSIKHYVPQTVTAVASGAQVSIVVVDATQAPGNANTFDVTEGSIVKAIHLEYWIFSVGATGSTTQFVMVVEKVPSNQTSVTVAQMLNLAAYPNKKNVLFTTQGVLPSFIDGSGSIPIMRDWFKIPKGKQRMGFGDRFVVSMTAVGQTIDLCGLATYKEYK